MYTRAVDKKTTKHFVLEILINTCKQAVKRQSHLSALEKKEKKKTEEIPTYSILLHQLCIPRYTCAYQTSQGKIKERSWHITK